METRKAQLTGGSTFTVSLPKEWANVIDLETGDTLRLYPRERTLIIEPTGEGDYWEATVDIDQFSATRVRRTIQALYTTGFTRLTLSASTGLDRNRRVISRTAREYISLEMLESTETQVTLQSLLNSATVSVEQSTVQIQQLALSMHKDAVTTLVDENEDLAEQIVEQDNQVDRLYAMISRHFQRSLVSLQETEELELDQSDLYDYQTTARQLERIADHAEKLANLAVRFDTQLPDDFADKIETKSEASRRIVEQAASAIIGDEDIEAAHRALDSCEDLTMELEELERQLHERDIPESHLIALVLDSLVRTAEYGANIAETALQTAARGKQL
jgi:phosphate uptake regulator